MNTPIIRHKVLNQPVGPFGGGPDLGLPMSVAIGGLGARNRKEEARCIESQWKNNVLFTG
jgi:hypothetical protein